MIRLDRADWKVWGVPFDPPIGTRQEDQDRESEIECVGGGSPERMAEYWAENHDHATADFPIVQGTDYMVVVENLHSRERWTYRVSGESRPVYRVREFSA